jgi:hypothetical protein
MLSHASPDAEPYLTVVVFKQLKKQANSAAILIILYSFFRALRCACANRPKGRGRLPLRPSPSKVG